MVGRRFQNKSRHVSKIQLGWSTGKRILILALIIPGLVLISGLNKSTAHAAQNPPLQWGPCAPTPGLPDSGQQCTTLSVPLDYQTPTGKQITIAISRIPAANPQARRGVLLLNPGGPGGSGLDLPRLFTILLPQSVRDEYDLVGFDPRGVGGSTPLSCGLSANQALQAYVPLTQRGSFTATANFMQQVANDCATTTGSMLPFFTTANTARDMDQVRMALGEQRISYLGYSYGTYLGAVYASLFPNNTDRIVLDSTLSPNGIWRDDFRQFGPAAAVRFPDFANFAAANDATYHLGKTPTDIQNRFFSLIDRLKQQPFTIPQGTNNGILADSTIVNDALFREASFVGLYDDNNFPPLASLWQLIENTPPATSARPAPSNMAAALSVPIDNYEAAGLAIVCNDASWSHSINQYQQELNLDRQLFPMFAEVGSNIWPCAFWANQPIEPAVHISSSGPSNILMIQNTRDPATPIWGAAEMRLALGQRARMMTVDQGGHTAAYVKPNQCASDAVTAFLADGTFPATDSFCPAQTSSPSVQPSLKLPSAPTLHDKAVQELLQRTIPPLSSPM